jgi:hypothetical protein
MNIRSWVFFLFLMNFIKNSDMSYYHNVRDKMFLLDVSQIDKLTQNAMILGSEYWKAKPTQKQWTYLII